MLFLDNVVAAAKANGIRLIVALLVYVHLFSCQLLTSICRTNNWSDYGGMDVYVNQIANSPNHDLFYTNANVIVCLFLLDELPHSERFS